MKTIRAKLLALVLILLPAGHAAADGYSGPLTVATVNVGQGRATFGTTTQPTDTCSYFGYYFIFDSTTADGKSMYAMLLAAKLSARQVNVWYTPSSARGTNENNGCVPSAWAVLTQVAIL